MPGGVTHVFQVIMLATGTDALLGGGGTGAGALVETQEKIARFGVPEFGSSLFTPDAESWRNK